VEALKAGAKDYLVKPFDPAEMVIRLRNLVEDRRRENSLEAEKRALGGENLLIGGSRAMQEISEQISRIALSDVTALITGESGVGKELVAREIHRRGNYAQEPFAAINIGGIHEGLMESELFGHEKGAFTGATARKQGLFELAGRGSIFLDEIGEMPLPLQVKLLRVLQERKIRRLGGNDDIPVNARIISATNRDIETLVREGKFREDLYYRLNVLRLVVPPLRDRAEDIPPLAEHLLKKLSFRMGRPLPGLSPEAMERLRNYPFPGNVRELENVLERALIYRERGDIGAADIDLSQRGSPAAPDAEGESATTTQSLEHIERDAIGRALARSGGNRTRAAAELGISRKTILNKIKIYGLDR
jgi:two-component system response regulator AtoC